MKRTFKLEVDKRITEENLIESCLAWYHSGYDYKLILGFYALANGWHISKLIYYKNLIEEEELK